MNYCTKCGFQHECSVCPSCAGISQPARESNIGWQCPVCRRINAPSVLECPCTKQAQSEGMIKQG